MNFSQWLFSGSPSGARTSVKIVSATSGEVPWVEVANITQSTCACFARGAANSASSLRMPCRWRRSQLRTEGPFMFLLPEVHVLGEIVSEHGHLCPGSTLRCFCSCRVKLVRPLRRRAALALYGPAGGGIRNSEQQIITVFVQQSATIPIPSSKQRFDMERLQRLSLHLRAQPIASAEVLKNFVGGEFVSSSAEATIAVTNPATGEEIARVPDGTAADDLAATAALAAYPGWRDTPVKARVEVLFRFKSLCEANLAELTALVVKEIAGRLETVAFATGLPDLLAGRILEVARGVWCHEVRRPVGVVASIVPFNFPAMVPLWSLATEVLAFSLSVILKMHYIVILPEGFP
eukprot:s1261_g33.t1